jgi:hypothetical protein
MFFGAELMSHLINVVILTAAVAAVVLWRYRAAVLQGMRAGGVASLPVPPAGAQPPVQEPERAAAAGTAAALAWERGARRRLAAVTLVSVGAAALVLTGLSFAQGDLPASPSSVVVQVGIMLSAAVPMLAVSLAVPLRRALLHWIVLLAATLALGMALAAVQRWLAGKEVDVKLFSIAGLFVTLAAVQLWQPLLVLLATGTSRLRGVAPIVFAGLLVFGLAPLAGSRFTQALSATEAGSAWALRLGFNGAFVALALPVAALAWWRLRALARAYERKRFSDAQLLARTWWLMFVAIAGVDMISTRPRPLATALGCVLAYYTFPLLERRLLGRAGLERARPAPRMLLVLRPFGYQARTERLFDRIAARWRLFGPVTTIAAPDVVSRTVDPADFLRFATGHVDESFVRTQADLDHRLATLDLAPDPDGRHRIGEFCCRDETWQATVVALMQRADAVVMDVRGVTEQRRGCEYELQQLAERLPPRKVVLVTDASTDLGVVDRATRGRSGAMRLEPVRSAGAAGTDRVFKALIDAAAGG